MTKKTALALFVFLMFNLVYSSESALNFEAGYDVHLRSTFEYVTNYYANWQNVRLDELLILQPYVGLMFGDIKSRFYLIKQNSFYYYDVVSGVPETVRLPYTGMGMSGDLYLYFYVFYINSNSRSEWFKIEEVYFGNKQPVWSEARYFIGIDPFNFVKNFYYMDENRSEAFGTVFKTSFFDRSFFLEFAGVQNSFDFNILESRISMDLQNFKTVVFATYSTYNGIILREGVIPYKANINYGASVVKYFDIVGKVYLECIIPQIKGWTFPVYSVVGIRYAVPETVTFTAEIRLSGSPGLFVEAVQGNPFGWQGWEASTSAVYSPGTDDNLRVLLGLKNTIAGLFEYELRYGYESMGNHKVDINLRLYQDFATDFKAETKETIIPAETVIEQETKP